MRRFELADSYWEIELREHDVQLRWGSNDRPMKRHGRAFANAAEATRYVDQQIAGQLAKGYVEVVVPTDDVEARRDEPAVERRYRFEIAAETRTAWRRYPKPARFLVLSQSGRRVEQSMGEIRDGEDIPEASEHTARDYASLEEANRAFDVDVEWATGENWKQVLPDPRVVVAAAVHEHPELEAACWAAAPDDPGPWSVYADWLIERGDPRGEIAALAGQPVEQEAAIVNLLRASGIASDAVELELEHGFARHVLIHHSRRELDEEAPAELAMLTARFLASPLGRCVESLRFGLAAYASANDWAPALRAVIESPVAGRVRELRFDAYDAQVCEISWAPYGDFTGLLARLPALELVHLKSGAGGTLGDLDLPALRTFIRESGGLGAAEIDAISTARWPRLEHLEIWFGSTSYGAAGTLASIRRILDARDLPHLGHLGLVNCEFVEDAIVALARSRILPQLYSLDLSKGILARRGVAALREHASAFRHLASIDLSENLLESEEADQIRDVLDNVIVTDQRERELEDYEEDEADGETVRYVAVSE